MFVLISSASSSSSSSSPPPLFFLSFSLSFFPRALVVNFVPDLFYFTVPDSPSPHSLVVFLLFFFFFLVCVLLLFFNLFVSNGVIIVCFYLFI